MSPTPLQAVYVSNATSGDIGLFHLDADKERLTLHARIPIGGRAGAMSVVPETKHLYATTRDAQPAIHSYAIAPDSGDLTHLQQTRIDHNLAYIFTEPSRTFLLGASYAHDCLCVYRVADMVNEHAEPVHVIGNISRAHSVITSRDGRFVYAASLGSDQVLGFELSDEGQLTSIGTVTVEPRFGPRHILLSNKEDKLYVLGEFTATVAVFNRDISSGQLAAHPRISPPAEQLGGLQRGMPRPNFADKQQPDPTLLAKMIWAADIHATPDERFFFVSERTSSQLLTLEQQQDGSLETVSIAATEQQPRGFNLDATGSFLVGCGERSDQVSFYSIDQDNGKLKCLAQLDNGQGGNWIEILPLDLPDTP